MCCHLAKTKLRVYSCDDVINPTNYEERAEQTKLYSCDDVTLRRTRYALCFSRSRSSAPPATTHYSAIGGRVCLSVCLSHAHENAVGRSARGHKLYQVVPPTSVRQRSYRGENIVSTREARACCRIAFASSRPRSRTGNGRGSDADSPPEVCRHINLRRRTCARLSMSNCVCVCVSR